QVYGFDGNDTLYGGTGNDTLVGQAGDDTLQGDGGDDSYYFPYYTGIGDQGSDTVVEAANTDTDWLNFFEFTDRPHIDLSSTRQQTVVSGLLNVTLSSSTGIENVLGGHGDDVIIGNSRDNRYAAYDGNDSLYGGDGNDILQDDTGDDLLEGDGGNDTYY